MGRGLVLGAGRGRGSVPWAGRSGGGALPQRGRGSALRKGALRRVGAGLHAGEGPVWERAVSPRPRGAGPSRIPLPRAAFPAGVFMRRAGKGRWGRHVAAAPEQVGVGVCVGTVVFPLPTLPGLRWAGWGLSRIGGSEGLRALEGLGFPIPTLMTPAASLPSGSRTSRRCLANPRWL